MSGGWPTALGGNYDDVNGILAGDENLPVGFAGLTPTSIAAAATTDVPFPLNAYIKVRRLVLGAAACVDLSRVIDLKVGTISLNVGTQGVPCVAFARDAVGTAIDAAVWATPSVPPVLRIQNATAAAIVYEGGVIGPVSIADPTKG